MYTICGNILQNLTAVLREHIFKLYLDEFYSEWKNHQGN